MGDNSQFLVETNFGELDTMIDTLDGNRDKYLSDLVAGDALHRNYNLLKSRLELMHGSPDYDKVIELLDRKRTKLDNHKLKIGTLGAFLYACYHKKDYQCDPACVDAIPPAHRVQACKDEIWMIDDGYMNKINEISSETANVYISNGVRPTSGQLDMLRSKGIRRVNLYQDGQLMDRVTLAAGAVAGSKAKKSGFSWLFILIIFIIILLIVYLIFKSLSAKTE